LSNHEPSARPSAFAEATADRRSAKREGWSTSSGRAARQFNARRRSPGLTSLNRVPGWRRPNAVPAAVVPAPVAAWTSRRPPISRQNRGLRST